MKKIINNFLFFLFLINAVYSAQNLLPPSDIHYSEKKTTIIIDPGHGGGDWGINYKGIYEKNITLDISKKIKEKLLKDNPKISVYMTRVDDQFLNINDRVNYANSQKGDIFLSIHCDFIPSESISGYKIYYMLSDNIAEKQKTELINWDFIQMPYINSSRRLASFIDQYMRAALIQENNNITSNDEDDVLPLESRGVTRIKSFILKSINMPAVVVEVGNIYNKNDFSYLTDKNIINQIAYHIKEGIINYLIKTNYQ
ncbi:MAG: N-acetylmuramoyl-L-alanine amidase [Candidatus Goldbacteria bacterium]|nr:N-acetylmuramoyl-L-alanine amidase [Candidatus Goldiibacteriota bacterium]